MLAVAVCIGPAAAIVMLALALLRMTSLWTFVPLLMAAFMSGSMIGPNATHGALEASTGPTGVSAAVFGFLQTACGTLVAAVASMVFTPGSAAPIAAVMAASGLGAALVYFVWVSPRERSSPPGLGSEASPV